MEQTKFARNLKYVCKKRKLTAPKLLKLMNKGKSPNSSQSRRMRRLIAGDTQPSLQDIEHIAKALKLEPGVLAFADYDAFVVAIFMSDSYGAEGKHKTEYNQLKHHFYKSTYPKTS